MDDQVHYSTLKIAAAGIEPGKVDRMICPFCDGGSSREVSCRLVRANPVLVFWRCFRDSCGRHGVINDGFVGEVKEPVYKPSEGNPYLGQMELLPPFVVKYIWKRYDIDPHTITREMWKYNKTTRAIVMPIWNWMGFRLGHFVKAFSKDVSQKKMTFWEETDQPKAHFPVSCPREDTDIWIVEDIISATRIAQEGYDAVALLGTYMSPQVAAALRNAGKERLFVALDGDTWGTKKTNPAPVALKKSFGMLFDTIKLLHIGDQDPKDMSLKELHDMLRICDAA